MSNTKLFAVITLNIAVVAVIVTLQTIKINQLEASQCKVWAIPQGTCERF